ncbi:unnamed protein product [Durusdinium trenchii]|uniref:Uncharacterized protein n=1 Tax=Durusdinium trenchii TaxID=1381693 RepID=A0ABP0KRI5_9DINO
MKDLSLSEDVLTQDSGSGSLQIPQDRPDVTNRSSVRSKDAEASSLRRDSAKDYLQAARQLAYTGSQRSQTSQRSQRSSQPSKRSWSSSQSLDEAGKDSGRRLRTTARKEKKDKRSSKARDSPGSGRDSHFLSLADASEGRPGISELALRGLDSVLRRPGGQLAIVGVLPFVAEFEPSDR